MISKKKLKYEILLLSCRVAELEERLCPCESHDWKVIDIDTLGDDSVPYYMSRTYTYKCKRCGKETRTWKIL